MDNFISSLETVFTSPLAIAFGQILTIGSFILAFYFYFKSKREKRLYWSINNTNIFKDHSSMLSDLDIKYKGEAVQNLSVSKIMVWNAGTETIDNRDISSIEPLRLVAKQDVKLLDFSMIQVNSKTSQFALAPTTAAEINLTFEYLDSLQGAVIQVVHSGTKENDLELRGAVKGIRSLAKVTGLQRPATSSRGIIFSYVFIAARIFGMLFYLGFGVFFFFTVYPVSLNNLLFVLLFGLGFIVSGLRIAKGLFVELSLRSPKGLNTFWGA